MLILAAKKAPAVNSRGVPDLMILHHQVFLNHLKYPAKVQWTVFCG